MTVTIPYDTYERIAKIAKETGQDFGYVIDVALDMVGEGILVEKLLEGTDTEEQNGG